MVVVMECDSDLVRPTREAGQGEAVGPYKRHQRPVQDQLPVALAGLVRPPDSLGGQRGVGDPDGDGQRRIADDLARGWGKHPQSRAGGYLLPGAGRVSEVGWYGFEGLPQGVSWSST